MKWFGFAVATATMAGSALAREQPVLTEQAAQIALVSANFEHGLEECTLTPVGGDYALSAAGHASFAGGGGLDIAIEGAGESAPTVAAHAINTKGTGATNHRAADRACALAKSARVANGRGGAGSAVCTVSGDPDAPDLRFTVPLSALGARGGHVTLMKREPGSPALAKWLSKKGYDYYQAQSDLGRQAADPEVIEMTVVASCDSSGLTAKGGKPSTATYDLAVGKKA